MKSAGFQFNERDAEIVHYVYRLRVATLGHLAALTNRSYKTLERRLPKLRDNRYVRRLKPRPHKGLYVLGPAGGPVLVQGGYAPKDLIDSRNRETEWKDLTIPHALLVASVLTKLILLTREGPATMVAWRHDTPQMWHVIETAKDGILPIRPDAYFALRHAAKPEKNNIDHFFLEADVGTMSHARIAQKITAYSAYHRERRHLVKHGIDSFRVAIITQTRARAENLKAQFHPAMPAAQRRAYCIVPLEDLTLPALMPSLETPAS